MAPETHVPTHVPPMQVELLQALPVFCHMPLTHDCGCWPLQFIWPGEHAPEQDPFEQVEPEHVTAPPHVPDAVQVSTPLPEAEHCVAPGAHAPWHAPATHAWLVQAVVEPQAPVALQT